MKKYILIFVAIAILVGGASLTSVGHVEGTALHSIQSAWEIVDSTTSAGTEPTALAATERTKLLVDAAITAASSGDDEISVFRIPPKWNRIRLRALGITNNGTRVDEIYLGSLGGREDCELTYSGSLAWTVGLQTSIYDQITFTSGGTYVPKIGDKVTGNSSGETAVIVTISALTGGAWADGDAAGTITYRSATGAFTNSETLTIKRANRILSSNAFTHAASDLIDFELADGLVITAKTGIWVTAVNPADDTNAEAEIEVKGADYLVIVTSATSADSKLLIKGK